MARLTMDVTSGDYTPKRGDLLHTNVGDRRERTWFVLGAKRTRTMPRGAPRYKLWVERWWDLEPQLRMRLFRSAERNGGQMAGQFHRYQAKKKRYSFEELMRQGGSK